MNLFRKKPPATPPLDQGASTAPDPVAQEIADNLAAAEALTARILSGKPPEGEPDT